MQLKDWITFLRQPFNGKETLQEEKFLYKIQGEKIQETLQGIQSKKVIVDMENWE